MKAYTITVNGVSYDVTVEEGLKGTNSAQAVAPVRQMVTTAQAQTTPVQTEERPATIEKPVVEQKVASKEKGNVKIEAGAAGKVFKVVATVGQKIKENETVVILEAMKMEIPVVSPKAGTIMSVEVATGDAVEAGAVLVTLND